MNVKPCVQCGYCCRIRPCVYGTKNQLHPVSESCIYLLRNIGPTSRIQTYFCGMWETIKELEKDAKFPMCGSGCSSTLFNPMRDRVLQVIKEMAVERLTK